MAALEPIGPTVVRGAESFLLRAKHIDQTFQIDVYAPPGEVKKPLPVVYVTDASYGFGMVQQTISLMQVARELPRMVVVGIGYPADTSPKTISALRFREFCPADDPTYLDRVKPLLPPGEPLPETRPAAAGAFLSFIDDELKPAIAAKYRIDANDQTHVGMSLGGLFALYGLFAAPKSFQRVVALSPSIWWNDRDILKAEAAFAATAKDLPVNLFLSIGALEEIGAPTAKMVSNLYEFDAVLRGRKYPGLRIAMDVFPQETHNSVYAASLTRGLRTVFGRAPGFESWASFREKPMIVAH
ncbi:MAG: alpha/beta hydrolase [Alphaproteobacteria bacterium]|nr:alpha/beta hydrolase [Alphaproteobacteria bacterium]MBL6937669.1 alpha/beta hydrolase [Alphaproteobacteria bacterium]MBL7099007.1 alpha/beta hydrolase [Alphaproteobacteria bacterium]